MSPPGAISCIDVEVAPYNADKNSIVWLRISFIWLSPVMIARYCLPPTSNVIGGALIPLPRLNVHSSCVLSSS
jgi:hypothetical protein